jgi:hypothetical protein
MNPSEMLRGFESCLREDSVFAPAYLHYGEWQLAQASISRARSQLERERGSMRAAEFCFWMAIRLESRDGHTTRRARKLLGLLPLSAADLSRHQRRKCGFWILISPGLLSRDRCLLGFPHPSCGKRPP